MKRKILGLLFCLLLLNSCRGIELKHLNPIPTSGNDGGLPGLLQDAMTGNWDRFKSKEEQELKKKDEIITESQKNEKELEEKQKF